MANSSVVMITLKVLAVTGLRVPLMGSNVVDALSPLVMSVRLPAALTTENRIEVMNPSTAPVTACSTRSEMNAAVSWLPTAAAILTIAPAWPPESSEVTASPRDAASPVRTTRGIADEENGGTNANQALARTIANMKTKNPPADSWNVMPARPQQRRPFAAALARQLGDHCEKLVREAHEGA